MAIKERHSYTSAKAGRQAQTPELDIQLDSILTEMHSSDKLKVVKKA